MSEMVFKDGQFEHGPASGMSLAGVLAIPDVGGVIVLMEVCGEGYAYHRQGSSGGLQLGRGVFRGYVDELMIWAMEGEYDPADVELAMIRSRARAKATNIERLKGALATLEIVKASLLATDSHPAIAAVEGETKGYDGT